MGPAELFRGTSLAGSVWERGEKILILGVRSPEPFAFLLMTGLVARPKHHKGNAMVASTHAEVTPRTDAQIIGEFIEYQIRFVEQKAAWNGHSVCPFARQGRLSGRIDYQVLAFSPTACLNPRGEFQRKVREFAAQNHQLVMLLIHPDRQAMSYSELERLIDVDLVPLLESLQLEAFSGHPQHPLQIRGVYLRREPFITLQLIRQRVSHRATQGLHKRNYFAGWTEEAMQYASAHSGGYAPAETLAGA